MITLILNQNPWWRDKSLISQDPKLRELERRPLRFRPELLDEFDLDVPGIHTLRGPRQIGKTTAVKLLIRDLLLRADISKEQVMYYSCDNIDTRQELASLLDAYFDHLRMLGLFEHPMYIFIDEITVIKEWQRTIKHYADQGWLERAVLILTGSSASDLRHGAERLPGRRGVIAHPDKVLLPMGFREYLRTVDPPLVGLCANDISLTAINDNGMKQLGSLLPLLGELNIHLERYLITGGYASAINDFYELGEIPYATWERYQQWVRGDISRSGKSERTARQIIRELLRISVSAFGWETIARNIDVATHKSVAEYMQALEDAFALKTLYQIDLNTGSPRVKKLKKNYFLDHFIQWAMRGWVENWLTYGDTIAGLIAKGDMKGPLAEEVIANDLFRRFDRHDWLNSRVFFWKNGGEVDFVVQDGEGMFPVEVKYRQGAGLSDCAMMKKLGFKRGIVVSRDTLAMQEGFAVIPLPLFLLIGL
jgi:predicted AAA+ superfamily ATPase